MFAIDDERHSERISDHETLEEAQAELRRITGLPWNEKPNRAPCTSRRKCGRSYRIQEFDTSTVPWKLVRTIPGPEVDVEGVRWPDRPGGEDSGGPRRTPGWR